jgi:hypothetical protein
VLQPLPRKSNCSSGARATPHELARDSPATLDANTRYHRQKFVVLQEWAAIEGTALQEGQRSVFFMGNGNRGRTVSISGMNEEDFDLGVKELEETNLIPERE